MSTRAPTSFLPAIPDALKKPQHNSSVDSPGSSSPMSSSLQERQAARRRTQSMRAPPSFSIQDLLGQPLPPEIVQATSPNSRLAARCFQNSSILFLHLFLVLFYFLSISLCVFSCSYVFCVAQMCVCVCVCVCWNSRILCCPLQNPPVPAVDLCVH